MPFLHFTAAIYSSPGVGKTHLAISIGIEACRQGKRTFFINCHELLRRLRVAYEKKVN